jgi:hypothetical protein
MCVSCYDNWAAEGIDYRSQQVQTTVVWEGSSLCAKHYNLARWGNDRGRPLLEPAMFEGKEPTKGAIEASTPEGVVAEIKDNLATITNAHLLKPGDIVKFVWPGPLDSPAFTPVEGMKVVLDTKGPAVSFALPDGSHIAHDPDPNGGALTRENTWRVVRDLNGSCWTFLLPTEGDAYRRLMHDFGLKGHTVTTHDFGTHALALAFCTGEVQVVTSDSPPAEQDKIADLLGYPPEGSPQQRLIADFHERTQRCLGQPHLDCAMVEQRHREGNHGMCLPVEDGESEPVGHTCRFCGVGQVTDLRRRCDQCDPRAEPTLCNAPATFGPDGANVTQAAKDAMAVAFSCDRDQGHAGDHQAHDADGHLLCWWEQKPTCQCRDSNNEGPINPPGKDEHDPTGLHYSYCPLYDAPVETLADTVSPRDRDQIGGAASLASSFPTSDERHESNPDVCEADTAIDGKHDWQPLHKGRVFTNLSDGSDTVSYEGCTACSTERSVPMVQSKAYDALKGIQS